MKFASPFPDVVIPDTSLYDFVFGNLDEADRERVALVELTTETEVNYGTLVERIDSVAAALAQRGIGVGDVVGLLSPNSAASVIALHGILRAGATATPINALSTVNEIAGQLRHSAARLLITAGQLWDRAVAAASMAGLSVDEVLLVDDKALMIPAAGPDVDFDPATHLAVLPYSSGTTGKPKGVMLTHRNLVANIAQLHPVSGLDSEETLMAVIPFFHIYGLTALLCAALQARARLIVMPRFDLGAFLAAIEKYRCTQAFIVPPLAVALAKDPMVESFDLSSLRVLTSAAAPLDEELANAVMERLDCQIVQAYGMTELSPASHVTPHEGRHPEGLVAPVSSCGWTLPNAESKILDVETGAEIPLPTSGLSQPGELCVRGPNVMAGYLRDDAATAEIMDGDGFLHTGDLARVDAHGCVYIVDRLKELIKYKGYQVAPAELEALLLTHPDIADVAVVGVVNNRSGEEIPKAFVVRQRGAALSKGDVIDFVARKVAPYKKIRQVEFVDEIPKSATGKILRRELRAH
ncbi:AMP-binding protein [Mycobacterium sherrisii]|uniref:AMP-dependent synthetase n=1 Tax=Mycobacterium sherrisii TaxID=243061 RepID=A0A1E3T0M0_9MYCO|nr:AMP-binding protein [Mycobacterium sherrisii]MEC4764287.1 AMP-binding protein [Mycobacterium sherrisii]ODR07945.1 AMP-dependent synthetase [Mycobacterium sherrisii]